MIAHLRSCIVFVLLFGLAMRTPAADQIAADVQLDRELPEIAFSGQGLADVIDFLRDVSGANIFVNWRALEAAGISKDAPINMRMRNIKFKTALTKMLESVGTKKGKAQYRVEDGMILISLEPDSKLLPAAVSMAKLPEKVDRRLPEVNFNGQALADVIDFMRDITGANIFVNWGALNEAGIDKDAPVMLRVRNAKTSAALKRILESVAEKTPLICTFEDNVISITAGKPKDQKPEKNEK